MKLRFFVPLALLSLALALQPVRCVPATSLAQTASEAQAEAQFVIKLIHKVIDHFFTYDSNQQAKVARTKINCIERNEHAREHGGKFSMEHSKTQRLGSGSFYAQLHSSSADQALLT